MKIFPIQIAPKLRSVTIAACLGAALLVLFVWVRSFSVSDYYRGKTRGFLGTFTVWRLRSGEGIVGLLVDRYDFSANPRAATDFAHLSDTTNRLGSLGYSRQRPAPPVLIRYTESTSMLGALGFQFHRRRDGYAGSDHTAYALALPFWAVFFLAIGYPLMRYVGGVVQRQREDRIALGLCPTCGTPMRDDLARCPGCDKPLALVRQV